ncbi:hypothetical protein Cch01nite_37530 [Cellulomonas chitinilytica]|uniref:D-alanyl-D-alanine carboxypeptidase-like core domain-containing protein n=1 Tax=Cellulomonas chitinilytica TaxID=398759 RepID=A0A919P845_9CELL|nr:hypothetical protein Cch01nite_37530 [Cellulomonas chitinilytica]
MPNLRRRSEGGKHVASTAPRPSLAALLPRGGSASTRAAQGAVVAALTVALCATMGQATARDHAAATADAQEAAVVRQARIGAMTVADDAVQIAEATHAEGTQAAVDPTALEALDHAAAHLNDLIEQAKDSTAEETPAANAAPDATAGAAATGDAAGDTTAAGDDKAVPPAPATTAAAPAAATPAPAGDATATGTAAAPAATPAATALTVPATKGPEDRTTSKIRAAVAKVATLATQVHESAEANKAAQAAAAAQQAADAAAAQAAAAAAEKEAQRAAWKASLLGYANGRIPASALCGVSFDPAVQLRCDAAESLEALNASYAAAFGTNLTVSDSYRSYGGQIACRRTKGHLCATPGTSNHGTGVAVDLGGGIQTFGTAQYRWMSEHAAEQAWAHPAWAEPRGGKPEPWHWEYQG